MLYLVSQLLSESHDTQRHDTQPVSNWHYFERVRAEIPYDAIARFHRNFWRVNILINNQDINQLWICITIGISLNPNLKFLSFSGIELMCIFPAHKPDMNDSLYRSSIRIYLKSGIPYDMRRSYFLARGAFVVSPYNMWDHIWFCFLSKISFDRICSLRFPPSIVECLIVTGCW